MWTWMYAMYAFSLMWCVTHVTIWGPWMIMACLYGICECEQHELYDMKHGKLSGTITLIEMCMKCEMKMRITWSLERDKGVMVIKDKCRNRGTSCIMCVHAFGRIPPSHHEGTDAYIKWQDNDRYALHTAAMTVLVLTGPGIRGSQSMPTG